jgi:hypothetical protein
MGAPFPCLEAQDPRHRTRPRQDAARAMHLSCCLARGESRRSGGGKPQLRPIGPRATVIRPVGTIQMLRLDVPASDSPNHRKHEPPGSPHLRRRRGVQSPPGGLHARYPDSERRRPGLRGQQPGHQRPRSAQRARGFVQPLRRTSIRPISHKQGALTASICAASVVSESPSAMDALPRNSTAAAALWLPSKA